MRTPAEFEAAARESGCTLEGVAAGPVARFQCHDGWASARLLLALANQSVTDPVVQRMARALVAKAGGDARALARLLHRFVQERVTFMREKVETFRGAGYLAEQIARNGYWIGDCDCSADLLYALTRAAGLPAKLVFFNKGGQPSHVAVQIGELGPGGVRWQWAETTLRGARFGEDPLEAARRLGIRGREDLGVKGTAAMGETAQSFGDVYVARLSVRSEDPTEDAIRAALEDMGVSNVSVWLDRDAVPPTVIRLVGTGAPSDPGLPAWARWTWDQAADGSMGDVVEGHGVSFEVVSVARAGDDAVTEPTRPRTAVMAKADALVAAYRARYGVYPGMHDVLLLLAVADLETGMGEYKGRAELGLLDGPSHNWGQIQRRPLTADERAALDAGRIPPPRDANEFLSSDTSPDKGAYVVWLWRFADDVAGADKMLETILDHEHIRERLPTMGPRDLAQSMYDAHYFEGAFKRSDPDGPRKNVDAYGAAIARHVRALGPGLDGWEPRGVIPTSSRVLVGAIVGLSLGSLVAKILA